MTDTDNRQSFSLHPQLAADTIPVTRLTLSDLLLCKDSRYLWCILVPRIPKLRDFHDVPRDLKMTLHNEIDRVSEALGTIAAADKINVAALGNVVEQLHVHVVARHQNDAAWPGPIWGVGQATPYSETHASEITKTLRRALSPD